MANTTRKRTQKTAPAEQTRKTKQASTNSNKRSTKNSGRKNSKRTNAKAEAIDLTNSDVEEIDPEFYTPPERSKATSKASASKTKTPSSKDLVKLKKEQYGSRIDLSQIPDHDSESEEEEFETPVEPNRQKANVSKSKQPSKTKERLSATPVEYVNLIGSDSDDVEESSPLREKAARLSKKDSTSTTRNSPTAKETPASQHSDNTSTPFTKAGSSGARATSKKQQPTKDKVTNPSQPESSHPQAHTESPKKRKDNVLVVIPVASGHGSNTSADKIGRTDDAAEGKARSTKCDGDRPIAGTDDTSDQATCLSMPSDYYPQRFGEIWAKMQSGNKLPNSKATSRSARKSKSNNTKDVPSSATGTPSKRKYAHFNDNPVEEEISVPKASKKTRKRQTPSPTPSPSPPPELHDDSSSCSEDDIVPDRIPKVKVSTSETYPGPRSEITPPHKRSTPTHAAPEPLVPIPARSKALARAKKEGHSSQVAPSTLSANDTKVINEGSKKAPKSSVKTQEASTNLGPKVITDRGGSPKVPIVIEEDSDTISSASNSDDVRFLDHSGQKEQPSGPQSKKSSKVRPATQGTTANSCRNSSKSVGMKQHGTKMGNPVKSEEPDDDGIKNMKLLHASKHHREHQIPDKTTVLGDQTSKKPRSRDTKPTIREDTVNDEPEGSSRLTPPASPDARTSAPKGKSGILARWSSVAKKKRTSSEAGFAEDAEDPNRTQEDQAKCSGALSPIDAKVMEKKERKKAKTQRRSERLLNQNAQEQGIKNERHEEKDQSSAIKRSKKGKERASETAAVTDTTASTFQFPTPFPCPWSYPEAVRLTHDVYVFASYLQEMTEIAQPVYQSMAKIPAHDTPAMGQHMGVDLPFMRQLIDRAASEGQMVMRKKSAAEWERFGEFLRGWVGTMEPENGDGEGQDENGEQSE